MNKKDAAVSPVVGVMLMLVVTIIVAAIVSGMAGGLIQVQQPAPSATFDVAMTDESLEITVLTASEVIPSKDISIVLTGADGLSRKLVPGASTVPFGFNIVEASKVHGFKDSVNVTTAYNDPEKADINQAANTTNNSIQWFGNYTLQSGSRMSASVDAFTDLCHGAGYEIPEYLDSKVRWEKSDFGKINETQWRLIFDDGASTTEPSPLTDYTLKLPTNGAIDNNTLGAYLLGLELATYTDNSYKFNGSIFATTTDKKWSFGRTSVYGDGNGYIESFTSGDKVSISIIHTPSGQTMFSKTIIVKEA